MTTTTAYVPMDVYNVLSDFDGTTLLKSALSEDPSRVYPVMTSGAAQNPSALMTPRQALFGFIDASIDMASKTSSIPALSTWSIDTADELDRLFIRFLMAATMVDAIPDLDITGAVAWAQQQHPISMDKLVDKLSWDTRARRPLVAYLYLVAYKHSVNRTMQGLQMAKLACLYFVFTALAMCAGIGIFSEFNGKITDDTSPGAASTWATDYANHAHTMMKNCYAVDHAIWTSTDSGSFATYYKDLQQLIAVNEDNRGKLMSYVQTSNAAKTTLMSSLSAELEADALLWSSRLWMYVWIAIVVALVAAYLVLGSRNNGRGMYYLALGTLSVMTVAYLYKTFAP